jgi:hypothetical protein
MTQEQEIDRFVAHARERGMDLPSLRRVLLTAGWKEAEIAEAFCAHELEMPIPQPAGGSSARETFMHLLAFTGLYTWIVSLIVLLFAYINLALPDPAWSGYGSQSEFVYATIRSAMAAIVVAFPLFLLIWRSLLKGIAAHPEWARGGVRRWLMYLSLFIGAVALVSDVITLIYYLFEGELSLRFVLKVVALFLVVGSAFLYLALTLKSDAEQVS